MTTNQNTTNAQSDKDLDRQLDDLVTEAKKVNQEIDTMNQEATKNMADLKAKVDESADNVDQMASDLDQIEKKAGDELDALALEQAEDIAEE